MFSRQLVYLPIGPVQGNVYVLELYQLLVLKILHFSSPQLPFLLIVFIGVAVRHVFQLEVCISRRALGLAYVYNGWRAFFLKGRSRNNQNNKQRHPEQSQPDPPHSAAVHAVWGPRPPAKNSAR